MTELISRRRFGLGLTAMAGMAATGCASMPRLPLQDGETGPGPVPTRSQYGRIYGPLPNEQFPVPAVDLSRVDKRFYRRRIIDPTGEKPGSIVVDTSSFYLYLVEPDGMAWRYGVGLGRAGFEWSGRARVAWKQEWPKWTPPAEMIAREPELEKYSAKNGGMPPGLDNPLGARALYIFQGNVDTLYRIHGSPEYWTIGKAVSSGCVRMMNQDVIHLYDLVKNGAPILVR